MATFLSMKTEVADWLGRDDLTTFIPKLINDAKRALQREINFRVCEDSPLPTLPALPFSSIAIPADTKEVSALWIEKTSTGALVRKLDFKEKQTFDGKRLSEVDDAGVSQAAGNLPLVFTLWAGNIALYPDFNTADRRLRVDRYKFLPDFVADGDTDFFSVEAKDLTLFATLLGFSPFLREDKRVEMWTVFYSNALRSVLGYDEQARYAAGTLQVVG